MRYDHFSMLPERAFQPRGRYGMTLEGGGGGGPTTSTTYTSNIPEYLRPQVEALIGGATQEYFNTQPVTTTDPNTGETKTEYRITGVKPFSPYSTNMQDYVAGFSPLQQQTQYEAAGMMRPGQYGTGTEFVGQAGIGGMQSAQQAMGYGGAGYGAGQIGQQLGTQGGGYYGGLGAGYGGAAAGMSPEAQQIARMGAGTGARYEQMATDPRAMQAYMSPYMQNVVDLQKDAAIRDAQKAQLAQNLGAARSGTYGGSRQLLAATERERALGSQLQNIQATGTQKAFEDAQRAQQFGITSGLQGYQTGLQGLGQAGQLYGLGMQGAGLGLQGVQQQLAGTAQGMQGAGLGLQGVTGAQAGYGLTGQMGRSLADIGTAQQAADIARMQFQAQQGQTQQAQEQRLIDQAIQNYAMAQEYPFQQLSRYSGLLRGYYTPSETRSTYQAYNPAAQLVGTASQAAGAIGALNRKKGGSVKEKKYAEGGITSIDQKVINDPTSFSEEMINKGIASGSISEMAGAIGLSAIQNAEKQAQRQQGLSKPAPQGTILGDLQASSMGIEAAPTQLPTSMAGGGIVAFDAGGLNRAIDEAESISGSYDMPGIDELTRAAIERRKAIGLGADEQSYRESLRKRPEELTKQREMDRYLALMKFGAGMAGAKTRNFAQALSEGTSAALPELSAAEKAYRTGTTEAQRGLAELDRLGRAEQLKGLEAGEAEFRGLQQLQARRSEAALDRASREAISKLDRESREKIANMPPDVIRGAMAIKKPDENLDVAIARYNEITSKADRYNAISNRLAAANKAFYESAGYDTLSRSLKNAKTEAERKNIQDKLDALRDRYRAEAEIGAGDLAFLRNVNAKLAPQQTTSKTMTMADVKATAAASGRTEQEVIEAAKARGFTIQ